MQCHSLWNSLAWFAIGSGIDQNPQCKIEEILQEVWWCQQVWWCNNWCNRVHASTQGVHMVMWYMTTHVFFLPCRMASSSMLNCHSPKRLISLSRPTRKRWMITSMGCLIIKRYITCSCAIKWMLQFFKQPDSWPRWLTWAWSLMSL